jgi:hypothetical protein
MRSISSLSFKESVSPAGIIDTLLIFRDLILFFCMETSSPAEVLNIIIFASSKIIEPAKKSPFFVVIVDDL